MTEIGSRAWIFTLAALGATTALAIDMSLPAQPAIAHALAAPAAEGQLTLSLFLVGYALGQVLVGALADALGRRRVLLGALALYTVGGLASAAAPTMGLLVAARVLQGLGGAGGPVLARAMVRDTQPVGDAARVLATMMSAIALAPMLAPTLGSVVLDALGWRAIFGVLATVGLAFAVLAAAALPETLPPERRVAIAPRVLAGNYLAFFRTRGTLPPTLTICLAFSAQFAFISGSPFVLMQHYGVPAGRYALWFGATAIALMTGATLGSKLLRHRTPAEVWRLGATTLLAGAAGLLAGLRIEAAGLLGLMAPMLVVFVGLGLAGPPATALALAPVPRIAGTASAILGGLQMLSGASSGYLVTRLGGDSPGVLAGAVALLGALAGTMALTAGRARPVDEPAPKASRL